MEYKTKRTITLAKDEIKYAIMYYLVSTGIVSEQEAKRKDNMVEYYSDKIQIIIDCSGDM
jgi:hypothetical protein